MMRLLSKYIDKYFVIEVKTDWIYTKDSERKYYNGQGVIISKVEGIIYTNYRENLKNLYWKCINNYGLLLLDLKDRS